MRKKILLFMDNNWSLGRFFTDLTKYMFDFGFDLNLVNYSILYKNEEFALQAKLSDYIITTPSGIKVLPGYGVPLEKCIMIMFHTVDVLDVHRYNLDISKLAKVAAINKDIQAHAASLSRPVELVHFGINTAAYYQEPSSRLETLGFAGAYMSREDTNNLLIAGNPEPRVFKRGYLVQELASELGLNFFAASTYSNSFISMPGFYASVDAVLCCSTDEGAGGPVLEGAAAGKLILTTNVGGYASFVTDKGGYGLPVYEHEFIDQARNILKYYKAHPVAYRDRCKQIQEYALSKYDLTNYLMTWVKLFS